MQRPPCYCADRGGRCDAEDCDYVHNGSAYSTDQCHVCWNWFHSDLHNRAWGGKGIGRVSLPCKYKGTETRRIDCPSCKGKVELKVFACAVHGECTAAKQAAGAKGCCQGCAEYEPVGFVADPGRIRHLLYHIYPLNRDGGRVWRWNVEKLKRRINLFNGKRVIGVAVGPETEPASAVRAMLAGCGCEFVERPNDPVLREMALFPTLLESASDFTGPEHATFYGHAKGITSTSWGVRVREWTEAMYSTTLDYWPAVRRLLHTRPVAGSFKRNNTGFFDGQTRPLSTAPWHYSGTFYWMRNADLFGRDWKRIDRNWIGSESYPGIHYAASEAACLAGEFSGDGIGLYMDQAWREWAGAAVAGFHEEHLADRWTPLLLTCVLTSHHKPRFVHESIDSVLAQTSADWQLIVMDTGDLIAAGEFDRYRTDPRILVVPSHEATEMGAGTNPQAWKINECFRRRLVRGDLVCYLCDDDVYDPGVFAAWLAAARSDPEQAAWYGPADRCEVRATGEVKVGELPTVGPTRRLDCLADGMQICHRRTVTVPWPEDPAMAAHGDGVFMDGIGRKAVIHPITAKVGRHRHTADSRFTRPTPADRAV